MQKLITFLDANAIDNWRNGHKLATIWVAGFWGAFGGLLTILPFFIDMQNIWWLGPLVIFMAITMAVARFTKQPGVE